MRSGLNNISYANSTVLGLSPPLDIIPGRNYPGKNP